MTLYFKNSYGKMRKIATIKEGKTVQESLDAAFAEINKFCRDRNFAIYYVRRWNTEVDGQNISCFDVGSHTEFFYLEPAIPFEETD